MDKNHISGRFSKLNPALDKEWLYLLSGLIWSGVGMYLCSLTYKWFQQVQPLITIGYIVFGLILAILISHFGFSGFALRNITRVDLIPKKKVCIFAFQQWTSYPLVLFMISLGIFLRKFSPIPKPLLGIMYIGIGGSLFLASFNYYRKIFIEVRDE